jgi:hypothetical protein
LNMQAPTYLSTHEALGIQTNALVALLNENFPPVTPTPNDSIAKIMYQSGQRSVVEFILSQMED